MTFQNPQGFTPELEEICEGICGDLGEPACWRLPSMIEPCEHITPCPECLQIAQSKRVGGEA